MEDFIKKLEKNLAFLPRKERNEILEMYEERILEAGTAGLESPSEIAKKIREENGYDAKPSNTDLLIWQILFSVFLAIGVFTTAVTFVATGLSFMLSAPAIAFLSWSGELANVIVRSVDESINFFDAIHTSNVLRAIAYGFAGPLLALGWLWMGTAMVWIGNQFIDMFGVVYTRKRVRFFDQLILKSWDFLNKWSRNKYILFAFIIGCLVYLVQLYLAFQYDWPLT